MRNRGGFIWGVLLILLGAFLLTTRLMPETFDFLSWPFTVIGVGGFFLLAAILTRNGGLAIPGCIVGGIGGILYYQNLYNAWASWSYTWTLIPGFVGIGVILNGLIDRSGPRFDSGGLVLMAISAVGFMIFGGAFGLDWEFIDLWPLFLIGAGVMTLISAFFHRR